MPRYEIINRHGEVLNTVKASADFMEANYPPLPIIADNNEGEDEFWPQYRELPDAVATHATSVTMPQARKALVLSGVALSSVQAALEAIEEDTARELALIDWEFSETVSSDSDLVQSMAGALSLSADDVAELFDLARTL